MNKAYIFLPALCLLFSCNRVANNDTDKNMIAACDTIYSEPQKKVLTMDDLESESRLVYNQTSKWVQPKKTENTIYCYFQIQNNKAKNLRMRIEYTEDKYENVDKYEFIVDDQTFEYFANKDRSSNFRKIFYWYDESVNQSDVKLIEALSEAREAKINLIDRATGVIASLPLSEDLRQEIKLVYNYYQDLGGSKIPRKGMVNIRQ